MNMDQFNELERRFEDVVARLEKIEGSNSKTWLQRNVGMIISTGMILVTLAGTWARIEASIVALHATDMRLEGRIDRNTGVITAHHENTDVHVDKNWRAEMRADIANIRQLLIEHMGDGSGKR